MLENASPARSTCRRCCAARSAASLYRPPAPAAPVVRFDNEHSRKYTVLEIVADDAPGLLYRISRVISGCGCDVDLVLIATEGKKAMDVLHITKQGKKLIGIRAGLLEGGAGTHAGGHT